MTDARASLVIGIVLAAGAAAQQPAPLSPLTFRTRTDAVSMDVAVMADRRPVLGLTRDEFELRDNGVVQHIDLAADVLPLDVTFTLDLSGSVSAEQLVDLRRAIGRVTSTLAPPDRTRLLTFTQRIVERRPLGAVSNDVDLSPAGPRYPRESAVLDAAAMTLLTSPDPNRRRLGILLTDTDDNASVIDAASVLEIARRSDVRLDVIAVPPSSVELVSTSPSWRAQQALTTATGGSIRILRKGEDVGSAFLQALEAFRACYVLRYRPTGVPPDGWHEVTIQVRREGRFQISARKGYFGS